MFSLQLNSQGCKPDLRGADKTIRHGLSVAAEFLQVLINYLIYANAASGDNTVCAQ